MAKRASGVLLHPTSLPGRFGSGRLGAGAIDFLDWLTRARQSIWQVLPLGPVGQGHSPYNALSSAAGNPWLIDPEELLEEGLIDRNELRAATVDEEPRIDFDRVAGDNHLLLRRAFARFERRPHTDSLAEELVAWTTSPTRSSWLEDWSLYSALKGSLDGAAWSQWPPDLRQREPEALERARTDLVGEIAFQKFLQFLFFRQWHRLRAEAHRRSISIFGDLPFYVALDSCEVWVHPELFDLDEEGVPRHVAGVPPDYFSATGQRWGNPVYAWERHAESGYEWWMERLRHQLELFDCLRLDHFRGFAGYWEIPAAHETAIEGEWRPGPGKDFFDRVAESLGRLPFVAEDLGVITSDVEQLRQDLGLPGMRVLQFAFDSSDSPHRPHNLPRNTVFYTGTHDNDTAEGWLQSLQPAVLDRVLAYLGGSRPEAAWSMVRAAATSVADWAVFPFQDLAGLDGGHRMNTPGTADGNWGWRLTAEALSDDLARRLALLTDVTDRAPESDE